MARLSVALRAPSRVTLGPLSRGCRQGEASPAQDDKRGDAPLGRQQKTLMEHIVRNQNDYETRLNYMYNNPMRWYYDKIYKDE